MANRSFRKILFESPSVQQGEEGELKKIDFEFERRLGDGAFGQVWRVKHKKTNQKFALKQVPKEKVMKMIDQFKREVYIMYELNHPHIVKLYNHFEDARYCYLIMELIEGGNLFHKLYREKNFLERTAAQYFREVLLAVEYLHSHIPAIIHRDIKPENILVDSKGRLKLTDFGWSNYYSVDNALPRFTTCGTLEYLPPEMVEERGHDTAADIWCLGILLFEMLTGSTPFKANIRDKMLANISACKPKFPLSFPTVAKDLISKMLIKDPSRRPSASEIKEHRWLLDNQPLRETITQECLPKPIPETQTEIKVSKGYKVINQNQEVTESIKEDNKNQSEYRESVTKLQSEIENKEKESIAEKTKIEEKTQELQKAYALFESLKESINSKKAEYNKYIAKEKEILSQISDVNLDLERVENLYDNKNIVEKVNEKSLELMKLSRETKLAKSQLNNTRESIESKDQELISKEKELRTLQNQLKKLKDELNRSKRENKTKISELETTAEILKSRIDSSYQLGQKFGKEERKQANEIMEFISESIAQYEKKTLYHNQIEEKIELFEETAIEKENQLHKLKLKYEGDRAELLRKIRKKKDEIVQNCKKQSESFLENQRKQKEELKQALRDKLKSSRQFEHQYLVQQIEIDQLNYNLTQLHQQLSNINQKILVKSKERSEIAQRVLHKHSEIEDIEMQIGFLKAKLLSYEHPEETLFV